MITPFYYNNTSNLILCQEMANWLDKFYWQIWATLTFKEEIYNAGAWVRVNKWLNRMKNWSKAWDLSAFIGMEITKWRAVPHFHLMINSNQVIIKRDRFWELWYSKNGRARLEPYNTELTASHYLTKYVAKGNFLKEFTWNVYGTPMEKSMGIFKLLTTE